MTIKKVSLIIFQPRLKTIPERPEWSCDLKTLADFSDKAKLAIEKAERAKNLALPDETYSYMEKWAETYLVPSEKGCQWCRARRICPALAKACLAPVFEPASDSGLSDLSLASAEETADNDPLHNIEEAINNLPSLDFATLARLYSLQGMIKLWLKAVDERMLAEMLAGEKHRDWKIAKGAGGHRKWRDNDEAEVLMKKMYLKVDEMYDKKVISPTSAEKLLLKKSPKKWAKLKALITRTEGDYKVVPMSSKLQSLDPYNEGLANLPDLTLAEVMAMDDDLT
jgi:hypothetical protein